MLGKVLPTNPFWRSRFDQAGIDWQTIHTRADLQRLPFLTKAELVADQQANPPYGTNLSSPLTEYSRLHQTSGTTGTPLRWLDTPASWNWMLDCWGQLFSLMGVTPADRFLFAFSFGPFLGFWAGFEGANRLGNLCIAGGGLSSPARLQLIRENQVTIVGCTPTYALRLAEIAAEQGFDLAGSSVRALLLAGEPGANIAATRRRLETAWGARVFDHWGMTELGPMAMESVAHPATLTLLETECIPEIIDPQTGTAVAAGEEGELVITNLGRWGSPLIRYRTGDRVRALPAVESPHGWLTLAGGILGRTDDMLTIRGNNLYPAALEDVLREQDGVAEFRIELHSIKSMQHLRIEVEPTADVFRQGQTSELVQQVAVTIKERWNFQAEVVEVAVGSLPRFEMKARRFFRCEG